MNFFLISTAYAASAGGAAPYVSQAIQFLPIVFVGIIFYFMIFRPQQQKQRQLKAEIAALRRGDRIVTAGGIIGVVQKARDDSTELEVEIATGVRVTVLRSTITTILSRSGKPANDASPARK